MLDKVLSIVINWNGDEFLEGCIISLQNSVDIVNDILIVDNASSDNSLSILKKYPKIMLIRNSKNVGYGTAINIGIRFAKDKYRYAYITNPDVIVEPDAISIMLNELKKDSKTIVVGPEILSMKDPSKTHYSSKHIPKAGSEYVSWLWGTGILVVVDKFISLGGFDERYFMYGEDDDLFYRIKKSKYDVKICYNATIYHYIGGTGIEKKATCLPVYYSTRNVWLFARKNLRGTKFLRYIVRQNKKKILNPGLYLPKNFIAFLHGNLHGILGKFGRCDLYFKYSGNKLY